MEAKNTPISPRITALQDALTSGNAAALEAFWQEIIEHGTPMIEAIERDEKHYLVTFLWRDQGETRNVVVYGGPTGLDSPALNQMTRLLDTDLWYKTYRVQSNLRGVYSFSLNVPLIETDESHNNAPRFLRDPLNPLVSHQVEEPSETELVLSLLELPDAPAQPWIVPQPGVKPGRLDIHHLRSQILNNERRVWVYTPASYTTGGEPDGLLLLFDGFFYTHHIPGKTILDNLVQAGKIPPLVAVMLDNPDQETRNRELTCHLPFVDFITQELLPWLHERYHVTNDPAQSIVGGSSYGGLAAAFVGLKASASFGNVLSQSGSFWWDKDGEEDIPQEWITQQFFSSPRLPLRFYLEVGLKEDWKWLHMVTCHRHLRDVLLLKGYEVHYSEFNGYHHFVSWRGSLADGLMALVGKKHD